MGKKDKAPKAQRPRLWRRLALGAAGIVLCAAGYGTYRHLQRPTFEKALMRIEIRQAHLERICDSEPAYDAARRSGMIIGMRYHPDNAALRALMRPLIAQTTSDEELIEGGLDTLIKEDASQHHATSAGTVHPTLFACFAKKVPQYVIFRPGAYTSKYVKCDADLRSVLRHELQHGKDFHYGITYTLPDGKELRIDERALKPGGLDPVFFENLLELRAYHTQLREALRRRETDPTSEPHLKRMQWIYLEFHSRFIRPPTQERERMIAAMQLRQCDDIRPVSDGKQMYLLYNHERIALDNNYHTVPGKQE